MADSFTSNENVVGSSPTEDSNSEVAFYSRLLILSSGAFGIGYFFLKNNKLMVRFHLSPPTWGNSSIGRAIV
jgi:hypothetical protein